ncbi:MAG TPA: undecaprenyldiphospho-muramoylpentapeptide beta-N-acetylglucosaminyltransferase [Spirochaetia bacterium]|nr:undecaprenyldiphospho-muramoylpentapeptide beta-N-acetylglucosaminyltransferase [Spirochaetia bacterium]
MGTGQASSKAVGTDASATVSSATAAPAHVVAIAGGGTAGHVFPGIAVAEQLHCRVFWIGSAGGVEGKLVRDAGIPFHAIPAGKLRRYLSARNITDIVRVLAGVIASVRILRRERPSLLFSKGGFVSVPPVVAARLCGIPCFTHESDFDPGLATRINLRFCERVFVSFPETVGFLPTVYQEKAVVTGNPVRAALRAGDAARGRSRLGCDPGVPLVLVMGGSLGSSFINSMVSHIAAGLVQKCFVVHQMGEKEFVPSRTPGYITMAFIGEGLADIMMAADLVVSRAGANTLSELAALGKPMVLIPLPTTGSRGDQLRNAEAFSRAGAAMVLKEEETTTQSLLSTLESLIDDHQRLSQMAARASSMSKGSPASHIAGLILERMA